MKSKKEIYVLFRNNQMPRIYVNPKNLEDLHKVGRVVKNPDMKKLKGIPVENWKYTDGVIKASKSYTEEKVKISVQEHTLPEVREIEVKHEYIAIEPVFPYSKFIIINLIASFFGATLAILAIYGTYIYFMPYLNIG